VSISRNTRELADLKTAELFDLYRKKQVGAAQLIAVQKAKVRMQMRKRVSAPPKNRWAYRLGYNSCAGYFVNDETIPILAGSTWNRKPKKRDPTSNAINQQEDEDQALRAQPRITHRFSTRSKRKARDKAMAFFRATFRDRVFLTLTFIEDVADEIGVAILNKFLTVVRKEIDGVEYLWTAERQEQNNDRLHFHLLLNRRLPIRRYNDLWIIQQYNAGLIGRVGEKRAKKRHDFEGRAVSKTEMMQAYKEGKVGEYFNGAHIEKAYCASGLAAYLTKYVTKQDTKKDFGCLTWHCSRKVSRMFTREVTGPSTFSYLLRFEINCFIDRRTGEIKSPPPVAHHGQFFSSVQVHNKGAPLPRLRTLEAVNKWIMEGLELRGPEDIPVLHVDKYAQMYT
jgi:hypothetical protein